MESLGIYVSVPFCRAKCSFCNFASGVWESGRMLGYVDRLRAEMREVRAHAQRLRVELPGRVDTVYFGGGTPSLLPANLIRQIFAGLREEFEVEHGAEITVEGAPGQFDGESLQAWQAAGVNRVSLGVQSFVDRERAVVGRLHTGAECRAEIERLRAAGVARLGVDLICGLPHQTLQSWRDSVDEALASGVEHVSVYMLEIDEGSRLGREALAGGVRYGAGALPSDDEVAAWYGLACGWLAEGGLPQYEISNFGQASRHNVKYWRRAPYVGFGLDAHSMLRCGAGGVRWGNSGEMEEYLGSALGARGWVRTVDRVALAAGFEEALFLGMRMNCGVFLPDLRAEFGGLADSLELGEMVEAGLVAASEDRIRLTEAGRMASNEVFGRLLVGAGA